MTTPPKEQAPEALRTHFEALASDPSFKLSRSRRGTYVNPAVARDWKWFQLGASQGQQPAPTGAPVWQGKWAWVPVEPSTAMLIAGNHGQPGEFSALKVWQDMLEALQRTFDYMRPVDPPAATTQPSLTPQADSQPAPQGETNAQLDTDSNPSAPGQQRDVAGSVALGQPVGHRADQAASHLGTQGNKLLIVAERNIRSFLRSAAFKSESDREAALVCVDVLWAATRAPAESVGRDAERWRAIEKMVEDVSGGEGYMVIVMTRNAKPEPFLQRFLADKLDLLAANGDPTP